MITAHKPACDQPIDNTGHARTADGELVGEDRGGLAAVAQDCQHAVLGKGEIDGRNGQLDLPRKTRERVAGMRRGEGGGLG